MDYFSSCFFKKGAQITRKEQQKRSRHPSPISWQKPVDQTLSLQIFMNAFSFFLNVVSMNQGNRIEERSTHLERLDQLGPPFVRCDMTD